MSHHLSHKQLCDLLLAEDAQHADAKLDPHREHLSACLICAAELDTLRTSVLRFRHSATSYSDRQLKGRHLRAPFATLYDTPHHGYFGQPLAWAVAALVLAITLPLGLHRHHVVPPTAPVSVTAAAPSTESDEALLEGISQDLATDIPSPMQPLADPTASAAQTQSQSNDTTQRKN